jgi:hypothetical protein
MRPTSVLLSAAITLASSVGATAYSSHNVYRSDIQQSPFSLFPERPPECPPCFNCNLADFQCHQFSNCTASTGRCSCRPGWGGEDCTTPLCGALSDTDRPPREGAECQCADGWGGINCNICEKNDICNALVPGGEGGLCYKGGLVVRENYQQCQVTNTQILKQLDGQIPQVTFSCNNSTETCNFQCKYPPTSYHVCVHSSDFSQFGSTKKNPSTVD